MKKKHLICTLTFVMTVVLLAGCGNNTEPEPEVSTPEVVETVAEKVKSEPKPIYNEPEKDNSPKENPYDIYKDPLPHILEDLADKDAVAPEVYITGDAWQIDEEELKQVWKTNYPYMEVVFGPIADDFWEEGLTYNMTNELLKNHYNEQHPEDNRIDMGDERSQSNIQMASSSLVHETGHIWLQYNDEGEQFNSGQWIWEAHTILFEKIATAEEFDRPHRSVEQTAVDFDLMDYLGPDALNGVMSDGNKACRSLVDIPAANALYLLDTVLSTPGTYDYWRNVSIARNQYCIDNDIPFTRPEVLRQIMNECANGKTIDGMPPFEWLYSRSVSNTEGKDGTYIITYGSNPGRHYDENEVPLEYVFGKDFRVSAFVFERKNGVETGLEGLDVDFRLYNAKGNERAGKKYVTGEDGGIQGAELGGKRVITPANFTEYSAIRIVATTEINGKEYSDTNYMICINKNDEITSSDNRMFFILINPDETINSDLKDIDVQGGYNVDKSHLSDGLLIVQAKQGEDVIVNGKTYSKPCGARVIPFVVE